jgi:hypothetical protein
LTTENRNIFFPLFQPATTTKKFFKLKFFLKKN